MDRLRQLVHEAHRRSVWQVMSVYLVASWVALQVVEIVSESAGLPDWAQPFALMLLVIGLPVVLATAVVQEGAPGRGGAPASSDSSSGKHREGPPAMEDSPKAVDAGSMEDSPKAVDAGSIEDSPKSVDAGSVEGSDAAMEAGSAEGSAGPSDAQATNGGPSTRFSRRLFTWRNAIVGGIGAFALLGAVVVGYFVMWSTGIGPVGSLAAQGVFDEGDAVVLAQFENTSDDENLGEMVTEALRVDLAGSSILTLVAPNRVRDALGRMGRSSDQVLDADLALEVAIRDGFKAVIHGTVGSAGSGYIFVASLVAAESGNILATFRETARGPDEVIDAIDKLSQDIRSKAGESLRVIKAEEPLEEVSTSSLEALRKYAEADRISEQGDFPRAIETLEEAIRLDPSFAMAYRKLAVLRQSAGESLASQIEAATQAYNLRDRLTERERHLAEAYYYNLVTHDPDAEIRAYRTVLERHPDDDASLNNISIALANRTRTDEAIEALQRAVGGPGASAPAYTNLPSYLASVGRQDEAIQALERLKERYPGRTIWTAFAEMTVAAYGGSGQETHQLATELMALPGAQGGWFHWGSSGLILADLMRGNLQEAREHNAKDAEEMKSQGIWDAALDAEVGSVNLELRTGQEDRALALARQLEPRLDLLLDSIPLLARDYGTPVFTLARLGQREAVDHLLERWKGEGAPSSLGPSFDQTQRAAEAFLVGRTDPAEGLSRLEDLSREINCPNCAIWDRAGFAAAASRWEEARNLYLSGLQSGSEDFLGDAAWGVLAHEHLGAVYEALGDSASAAEHYRIFADAWADADPELQPRVQAARDKAASLGESGPTNQGSDAPTDQGEAAPTDQGQEG